MDAGLLAFALFLIGMAVVLFRIGFARSAPAGAARAQAGFVMIAAVLVPALLVTLALQATARGRLERLGIRLPAGVGSAVGVAVGLGPEPTWVFRLRDAELDPAVHFREESVRPGWELLSSEGVVTLHRAGEALTVMRSRTSGTVTFQLRAQARR